MTDEVLKRRLIGAAVLLLGAVVLASLLPEPGSEQPPEGVRVVTMDLDADPPAAPVPVDAASETPPTPQPEELAQEPVGDAEPQWETPPATAEVPPEVAAVPPPAATPTPPDPTPAPQAAPSRPSLRLESAIGQRPAPPAPAPPSAAPARPSAAPASPASSKPPAATPAPGPRWTIQVGSFNDIGNARALQDKLKADGYESLLSPAETDKGTLYRVRTGSYVSRAEAASALGRVQSLGHAQAAMVEN